MSAIRFTELFKPGFIGKMAVKNRIVVPPMLRNWATEEGAITDLLVDHYAAVAKGGVGLIIVGASYIHPGGRGFVHQVGIHNDKLISGLRRLAEVVHANGAKVGIQVYHAGRQTTSAAAGAQPVAPSPIPCPVGLEMPRELTIDEIEILEEAHAEAARRAKEAGFDTVYMHGGHGYLINQFLSPYSNKRTDKYGGYFGGRVRFAMEVVKRTRQKVGPDFPIMFRMSGDEYVTGGLDIDDSKLIAPKLEEAGIDALVVSAGVYESVMMGWNVPPMSIRRGCFVHLAEQVRKVVKIPVLTVGRINNPELAESILREKKADFVEMGRASLADPEWPKKASEGKLADIRLCTACLTGCIDRLLAGLDAQCAVNPEMGREREFAIMPAAKPKRVLVAGGGPAGMEAARVAALRGHQVTLYENNNKLGGQQILAAIAPRKEELETFTTWLSRQIKNLRVKVALSKEVTPALVKRRAPDVVIVATGSKPLIPKDIPGLNRKNVVSAHDALAGKADTGETVIVAGGGVVGCETTEFLAAKGKRVKIVEMLEDIALDMGLIAKNRLMERFTKLGVEVFKKTKIKEITDKGVVAEREGKAVTIEGDTVVLALGAVADKKLAEALKGKVPELYEVGDCVKARTALEAVYEGSRIARQI